MLNNKWFYLFFSNFLGVFNDNFLKNSIIFIAIGWTLPVWFTSSQVISVVSAGLVVPYLLFSPYGGKLARHYSKTKVFRAMKIIEIPIVLVAITAFYFNWIFLAIFSVFLLGTQSCLYSPSKYGLIRDIGGKEGVSFGSGMFETMAFLGILIGTFSAALVSDRYSIYLLAGVLLGVAILGYAATKAIRVEELPAEKEPNTSNPVKFVFTNYKYSRQFKLINSSVFGASAFWLIGSLLQMNIIIHCKNVLQVSNSQTGIVMAFAAIGIALGTAFTGKISKGKVKKGFVIPALSGMILSLTILFFIPRSYELFIIDITVFSFLGGIFQVPNLSLIQHENLGRKIGDIIAYLNMVTFFFILISAVLFSITTYFTNENSYAVFGVLVAVCVVVLAYFLFRYSDYRKETAEMVLKK